MTRENKLALIVGFGLILLVGILVSDYFSDAQRQRQDNLGGIIDPLSDERQSNGSIEYVSTLEGNLLDRELTRASNSAHKPEWDGADPIEMYGKEQPRSARPNDGLNGPQDAARTDPREIQMGGGSDRDRNTGASGNRGGSGNSAPAHKTWTEHHVRANENLTSICNRYYKTKSWAVVLKLAEFNDMDDPNAMREGRRLRIPKSLADLQSGLAAADDSSSAGTRSGNSGSNNRSVDDRGGSPTQTYTVKSGDTLSEIASATMGSAGKWQELFEFNRDVLDDPSTVRPGTVLRIPST